ncbi:MAG: hypothetical protein WDN49_10190 [Acetobacteraceae bacterium]
MPVPGWTLPGVMTVGAVQILLKSGGLVTTEGLVLAGSGPLLYLLAGQLLDAGAPPAALLDTAARADEWQAMRYLPAALQPEAWGYLRKGAGAEGGAAARPAADVPPGDGYPDRGRAAGGGGHLPQLPPPRACGGDAGGAA